MPTIITLLSAQTYGVGTQTGTPFPVSEIPSGTALITVSAPMQAQDIQSTSPVLDMDLSILQYDINNNASVNTTVTWVSGPASQTPSVTLFLEGSPLPSQFGASAANGLTLTFGLQATFYDQNNNQL